MYSILSRGFRVHRYTLSALKSYLALSVPFRDLQAAYKTIMDNNSLRAVLACSLDLIDFNLFYQFTKNHGVQRFHLHKASYRLDEVLLGLPLLSKTIKFCAKSRDAFLGFIHLYLILVRELHKPFVRNLAVYVVLVNLFI